jgi:hypothetical protein
MGSWKGLVAGKYPQCCKERSNITIMYTGLELALLFLFDLWQVEYCGFTYKLKNTFPATGPLCSNPAVAFSHNHPIAPAYGLPGPAR